MGLGQFYGFISTPRVNDQDFRGAFLGIFTTSTILSSSFFVKINIAKELMGSAPSLVILCLIRIDNYVTLYHIPRSKYSQPQFYKARAAFPSIRLERQPFVISLAFIIL